LRTKAFGSKTGRKAVQQTIKIEREAIPCHSRSLKIGTEAVETFATAGDLCRGWAAHELLQ